MAVNAYPMHINCETILLRSLLRSLLRPCALVHFLHFQLVNFNNQPCIYTRSVRFGCVLLTACGMLLLFVLYDHISAH